MEGAVWTTMSHHVASPQTRKDVRLDIADLYVFRGDEGTAFVMNVNHSLASGDVTGTPPALGFHPEARYEFKLDTDGDAVENLVYRFSFGEPDNSGRQSFSLQMPPDPADASVSLDDAGNTTLVEGFTGTVETGPSGVRVWSGCA
jgi:hypothetical protein